MDNTMLEDMIREWIECTTVCEFGDLPQKKKESGLAKVDRYMEILPGAEYVLTQTLNYIFSNGLTTGSLNEDKLLNQFLYHRNEKGNMNLSEIRSTIGMAISHGGAGLRWYKGNVYQYKWGEFRVLTYKSDGIEKLLGYVVSKDGGKVPYFDLDWKEYREYEDFIRDIDDKGLILLSEEDFIVIRNDTSRWYGKSPLLEDTERLDLLVSVYERLNYDITYDGPGRIIIRPKDGYASGDGDDISSTEVMAEALEGYKQKAEELKKEAKRIAAEIKKSSSDSVIMLSNAFSEKVEHLERVTKATEFFNWISNEGMILAQDFGMAPSLLELGKVSGNVSMSSIIDNSMENSIIPLRERYATQLSMLVSRHLSVSKVYFDFYKMSQQEDENSMRTRVVNILAQLNAMTDAEGEIRPEALELFRDFSDMLKKNIHNENNVLEEL